MLSIYRKKTILTLVVLLGIWSQAVPGWLEESGVSEKAWINWVRAKAIRLKTLNWKAHQPGLWSYLDKALEGKRIVFLGEPDHYLHEKYDFRLILIRYLVDHGFSHIGMEMGQSDGKRIDRYLETGDPSHIDRVGQYGYKGNQRSDRNDELRGFAATKNPKFKQFFLAEERWFLAQLQALNESRKPGQIRLHWFGFDVDGRPGGTYVDAQELLEKYRTNSLAQNFSKQMARVEGESVMEEAQRIQGLVKSLKQNKQIKSLLGTAEFTNLVQMLAGLVDSLIFLDSAKEGPASPRWIPALHKREEAMFRHMDNILKELNPEDKIILLAHNMHLSKDSDQVSFLGLPMWPSIGTHLAKKLPGEVYSIWMLYDHGLHANVTLETVFEKVASSPARIEHLMAKAGFMFFLPFFSGDPREAYLNQELNFVLNGNLGNGFLKKQADAIFFVSEVTAIRKR